MHIGLIGGIGPAATDYYYRRLIAAFASKKTALELTVVHADAPTLINNLADNNVAAQVAIYSKLTERLVAAGAGCVVITSIGGHFCIDAFEASSPLPVINMLAEVNRAIAQRGLKKIGILGTRTVMESRFYGRVSSAEIIPPRGQALDDVHQAYVEMAATGVATEVHRKVFSSVSGSLLQSAGVEAIMLGGTDLALVFNENDAVFPIVDCAGIHADAVAKMAMP
jgi:aspartate racemase